ncbi:MAG TPA: CHAT domain-containing protein, partial [Thermoanaerobaculia bacterium]|nr:CHAT domain-containing protein [Thermoanaerobaculia bacterium]
MDHCQELSNARRFKDAEGVCLAAFDETGDPEALILAGNARWGQGDPGRARTTYERALKLAQAGDDPRDTAQAAERLFYMAWEKSEARRALGYALTWFEAAEEAGDGEFQVRASVALYTALSGLGDLDGAGRALERALKLREGQEDAALAQVLLNLGALRLDEGRMALSREASERALALAGEGREPRFYRSIHLNLVEASLALGDLPAAERHLAAAERYAKEGEGGSALLYYQSRVEHARGREGRALEAVEKALAGDPPSSWAWELAVQQGVVEEALGHLQAAEASYARAADLVEATRADLGYDEFKATLLDARRRPLEALFRLQAQAGRSRDALSTVERATARTFLDAFIQSTSKHPMVSGDAADRAEALKDLIPTLSQSPAVAPRSAEEILGALGDRQALIFFEAEGRFWRIGIGRSRIRIEPLAPAEEVGRRVDDFLARPDDGKIAEDLGRLLLEDSLPAPGEPVYLVPDGVLGQIPFAALRLTEHFLVEEHPIVYLPSLSALAATSARPEGETGSAVVLGDPRGDLPAAAREAREVAAGLKTVPRIGKGAARPVLEQAAGASVLHLATHTGIGPRGPWLALADGEVGSGFLLAHRIRPRLVTLATCASAARRGRGLWG